MLQTALANLKQNLLAATVLFALFVLFYTKWKGITIVEFIKEMREVMKPSDE